MPPGSAIGWRVAAGREVHRPGDELLDAEARRAARRTADIRRRARDAPCRRRRRSRRCRRSRRPNCSSGVGARRRPPSARTAPASSIWPSAEHVAERASASGPLGEQEGHRGFRPEDQLRLRRRRPRAACADSSSMVVEDAVAHAASHFSRQVDDRLHDAHGERLAGSASGGRKPAVAVADMGGEQEHGQRDAERADAARAASSAGMREDEHRQRVHADHADHARRSASAAAPAWRA